MRNRLLGLVIFVMALLVISSPAAAQVYFPSAAGHRAPESEAAAKAAPIPQYDPHDLSGVWLGRGGALLSD
jgi:hypothetical protein